MNASLQQLEGLFTEAVALSATARAEFLARSCGGDAALRARVEGMLHTHATLGDFMEATVMPGFAEVAPGARIGRYKLLEKIGEGGVGVVFMAEQEEPVRRKVALKVIKPGMDSREVIARFESERQALALMDHPNIARVFDAGATPAGRPFFVMELVRGPAITSFCDEQRLALDMRLGLFVKVCHALQHAHAKGIVHRDIKASNILVANHDGEFTPKVIDFGIAKATEFKLTEKTLITVFPRFMGTPGTMSPEQAAENGGEIDARSDVYGLGVLLCELVTSRTPLGPLAPSLGFNEIRRRICEEPAPSLADLLSQLDVPSLSVAAQMRKTEPEELLRVAESELSWVALRCLAKERAERYASARVLADDVQRFLAGERVDAKRPALLDHLKNQLRGNRAARWIGVAAAAAVDGFASRRAVAGNPPPPPVPPRTINVEAHRLVLEGRKHWNEFTEEGFVRAEVAFQQALELSPDYAMALTGLAYVAGRRAILAMVAPRHIEPVLANAERHARAALALDANIAEAHAVIGAMQSLRGRHDEAVRHLQRALVLNANSELAWVYLGRVHLCQGRPDLALPELDNGRLLLPIPASFSLHRAFAFLGARRFRDALAVVEEAERVGAANPTTRAQAGIALTLLSRNGKAIGQARAALDPKLKAEWTVGGNALSDGLAAWTLVRCGARAEAEEIVRAILSLPAKHHFAAGFAVALLGEPGKALELLADSPYWSADSIFLLERESGCFRGSAGFEHLLRQLNATEAWNSFRQMAGDALSVR